MPNLPASHWGDNAAWEMVEALAEVDHRRMKALVGEANFMSVSLDEATACDRSSLMSIHLHVMKDWERQALFLTVSIINCKSS